MGAGTQTTGHRRIVVISDFQEGPADDGALPSVADFEAQWARDGHGIGFPSTGSDKDFKVEGGYLERLPLACVKAGLADVAEIWTHWRGQTPPAPELSPLAPLVRRAFRMNGPDAPFSSNDMLAYIHAFGAPEILCVWGLGVSEDILLACQDNYRIYNSIDAPALRIPSEVSRHFDLVLTGAQWQSDEVEMRHPGMRNAILPVGPEFAAVDMFHPLGGPKPYDIIYVAAAQAYKRHDILFDALDRLPRSIRALCVFGYGEDSDRLRDLARAKSLSVDFVGPPGVPFAEVNRLMNLAKFGVVCGVDDGAPAILTEYMLAGLPVLANSALRCGLHYITPQTGLVASVDTFDAGILQMLAGLDRFSPRQVVLEQWTWPHSVEKLRHLIESASS